MRMLVVFEKGPALRHIGHLDLMRAMQRILRRTGLPVSYSQGFNPHMIVNFAAPLSVGAAGMKEIMDVSLTQNVTEDIFLSKINEAFPPALKAVKARSVADAYPAPMSRLYAASYKILVADAAGEALSGILPAFLERTNIPAMRKTKSGEKPCDIRPMIYQLSSEKVAEGHLFSATLAVREEATCKPDLLMTSLSEMAGIPSPYYTLTRTGMYGIMKDGRMTALEDM